MGFLEKVEALKKGRRFGQGRGKEGPPLPAGVITLDKVKPGELVFYHVTGPAAAKKIKREGYIRPYKKRTKGSFNGVKSNHKLVYVFVGIANLENRADGMCLQDSSIITVAAGQKELKQLTVDEDAIIMFLYPKKTKVPKTLLKKFDLVAGSILGEKKSEILDEVRWSIEGDMGLPSDAKELFKKLSAALSDSLSITEKLELAKHYGTAAFSCPLRALSITSGPNRYKGLK